MDCVYIQQYSKAGLASARQIWKQGDSADTSCRGAAAYVQRRGCI